MLLPYFQAIESGPIGATIRDSLWLFPFVEAFHLLALAVIGGAVLLVDFRLLGLGLKRQPVAELARDTQPWLIGSLLFMIASGVPLFMSEARISPAVARAVGAISILLWSTVGWGGRWIGFS